MKKIGVITFHKSLNYGAFLQAFALQKTLESCKTKTSIINYENKVDKKRYSLIKTTSLGALIKTLFLLPINIKRRNNFIVAQKKLTYTKIDEEYDIAITGSDQVWNPKLVGNKIDGKFFLEGISAKRKISYAASVAEENVIKKFEKEFKSYLSNFNKISVRETSAKDNLEKIIDKEISVTVDPTLLLNKKDWLDEISDIRQNNKPYIFTYFVGGINKKERDTLAKVCKNLNMKCVTYSKIPKEKKIYRYAYMDGPFKFLARLRDSKLVITSSFHGVAMSIILQKNFYYFLPRTDKRSRVDSLLKILGLTDRIIETEKDIDKINLNDIDYTEPNKKLEKFRQSSLDWLKDAIEE